MKRFFAIFLLTTVLTTGLTTGLSICCEAYAQDDVYLVPNPLAARWSFIETDNNGKHTSTFYYSVESIDGDAVNGRLKLRVEEVSVDSPTDTVKSFDFYLFKDGEFIMDMRAGFEYNVFENKIDSLVRNDIKKKYKDLPKEKEKEVIEEVKSTFIKTSGEMRGIPRYPVVGKLPDCECHCKVNILSLKVVVKDRRIVGKEDIQTEAGSFDCFILEETMTTKFMMMKNVDKIRSWYAYGIGLVKEVTYDKNGKLVSTMILNEVIGDR